MKTLICTAAWLAAALGTLAAQQSTVFVASSSDAVTVMTPAGVPITTLSGPPYNFNGPYDIVVVQKYNLVVVSNNLASSLTVFDSRSPYAFVTNVPVPNGSNLRGMSVSGDEEVVFVAGQNFNSPNINPAVFRILMADLTSANLVAEIADNGRNAEDCVVINASRVGGAGNGPGKIYFSVPNSAPNGYIEVISFNPPGPQTSISTGTGALANVILPTRLERTPDHSLVFGGCTVNLGNEFRTIRIVPGLTDSVSQPIVFTDVVNKGNEVIDIAFGPGASPRGYVITERSLSGPDIREINTAGNEVSPLPVATLTAAGRLRYDNFPAQLYVGETTGAANGYSVHDASGSTVGVSVGRGVSAGPRSFAFSVPTTPPAVTTICPTGQIRTGTSTVEIRGSGFDPLSTVDFLDGMTVPVPVTSTFVNSGLLIANVGTLAPDLYGVQVTNPDAQQAILAKHYLSINGPGVSTPSTVLLPSRFQGYQMLSFPQYYTANDLRTALLAQFGSYNPSFIRAFIWNGSGYAELSQIDPANLCDLSGRSFWALTRYGSPLTLSAPDVAANSPANPLDLRIVALAQGWNMISQPNVSGPNAAMLVGGVLVYDDSNLTNLLGDVHVVANATTISHPVEFLNGQYVFLVNSTDRLEAGKGYWIRNNSSGPLYLEFQALDAVPKGKSARSTKAVSQTVAKAAVPDLPPPPPGALEEEDGGTSGCGALGLEPFVLLAFLRVRRRRTLAA